MELLTVFTPAYNRAHTLPRTYESLFGQTCKDFIWLIIDDGSSDDTAQLVQEWKKKENGFRIEYVYKENGGMHTAHNLAYSLIQTEINVCIDSDDAMPNDAVETIVKYWKKNSTEKTSGMIALDSDFQGNIIGTDLPCIKSTNNWMNMVSEYHINGDKKFIYRTSLMKSIEPYPEFSGEKLVPLSYKYRIAAPNNEMLILNKVVCLVDYQPDGSTNTIQRQYIKSPKGFAIYRLLCYKQANSTKERVKNLVQYIAECRISKRENYIRDTQNTTMTILLLPFGCLCEWYYYLINRKK